MASPCSNTMLRDSIILNSVSMLTLAFMLMSGCASRYDLAPPLPATAVTLESYAKIFTIEGYPPEDPYNVALAAGPHTVVADYATYTGVWCCTLSFDAKPGGYYEIIDRSNPEPIVLVRRERFIFLISNRYEAVLPSAYNTLESTSGSDGQ